MPTDTVRPTFHAPSDSSLASLPMDLLYCIIDTLSADRGTIANCALVCQAWLHPARTHLFHKLYVIDTAQGRTYSDFLAFVTGHVRVAQYIHDLFLITRGRSETDIGYLPALLSRLPGLRILRLRGLEIVRPMATRSDSAIDDIPPSHNAVPTAFSLDELHVLECRSKFGSLRHSVEDILCLFEHVGHLSLELAVEFMPEFNHVTVPLGWHPPRHVQVGSMDIYLTHHWWTNAATMLREVIATRPGPSSLSLRCGNCWADVCASGALIREIGMDLRTLTLNFRHLLVHDRTISAPLPSPSCRTYISRSYSLFHYCASSPRGRS
ncbi:hypothetical protein C8Q74DRAFT_205572 [Fomes fomentarius]|nr:hypothetical protein C8Q74DRAFT_205572 [Fomes fomentarius]